MRYFKSHIFVIVLSVLAVSFTGCSKEDIYAANESFWKIRYSWEDVYSIYDTTTDFYEDGTVRMVDHLGTHTGTWEQNGERVSWTLQVGEIEWYSRAYIDRNTIQGTMTTSAGRPATLFGTRND